MSLLARADKRAVSYGVAGWLLLSIGGAFWALPHIEDELDEEALSVASYVDAEGFEVEWNGRDGYLTVPAGTSRADAERIAADLGNIRGTRDVEILFAELDPADATAVAEPESTVTTVEPEVEPEPVETTVADTPASFVVGWDVDGVSQTGTAPQGIGDEVASLGVAEPVLGPMLTVEDNVADDLAALAPLIGTSLVSGTATVAGGVLSISALAASDADLVAAQTALADANAEVVVELVPSVEGPDQPDVSADAQTALDALAISDIQFETNTSTLTGEAERIIDDVAAVLEAYPGIAIEITGHTDSRGDDLANQVLSEARAATVAESLVARGIDPERLESSGRGEAEPVASNETTAGQQQNRRVDITIKETNR